jgi:hypothetical protein
VHRDAKQTPTILKTDERGIYLKLGHERKFYRQSLGWDENGVLVEGDKLEVAVKNGCWGLTHLPAGPRPAAERLRCYFPVGISRGRRGAGTA